MSAHDIAATVAALHAAAPQPTSPTLLRVLRTAGDVDRNPGDGSGPMTFCHEAADALVAAGNRAHAQAETMADAAAVIADLERQLAAARAQLPADLGADDGPTMRDIVADKVFDVYNDDDDDDDDQGAASVVRYAYKVADYMLSRFRMVPRNPHSVPGAPLGVIRNQVIDEVYAAYEHAHLAAAPTRYGIAEHRAGLAAVIELIDPNTHPDAEPGYYAATGDKTVDELVDDLHLLPRHIQTHGVVERLTAELRYRAKPPAASTGV
jgi:hypothetical protein